MDLSYKVNLFIWIRDRMKKKGVRWLIVMVLACAWCTAVEYNDQIVDLLSSCHTEVEKVFTGDSLSETGINNAINYCNASYEKVEKLEWYNGDLSFKNAVSDYLEDIVACLQTVQKIIPYNELTDENFSDEMVDEYNELLENIASCSEKSEKSLEDVMAIQRSFALKYEFELENTGNVENTLVN